MIFERGRLSEASELSARKPLMSRGYRGRKEVTMPVFSRAARPSLVLLTALALNACGGGGGQATPTSSPKATASPTATATTTTNSGNRTVLPLQADQTQLK